MHTLKVGFFEKGSLSFLLSFSESFQGSLFFKSMKTSDEQAELFDERQRYNGTNHIENDACMS